MRSLLLLLLVAAGGCSEKPKDEAKADGDSGPSLPLEQGGARKDSPSARRPLTFDDMSQLGISMFQTVLSENRLPTADEVKETMRKEAPVLRAALDEGAIVLVTTTDKTGLWAYEREADKKGGLAVVGGRANRYSAEQVTAMLAKK